MPTGCAVAVTACAPCVGAQSIGTEKPLGSYTPAAAAGMQARDEKFSISGTIHFASEVMQ